MSRSRLSRRFLGLSMTLVVAGCTLGGESFADPAVAATRLDPLLPKTPFQSEVGYQMYNTLVAEMLIRDGKLKQAAQHYVMAASRSEDVSLVKRATETALQAEEPLLVKAALERWTTLEPDSVEARQYRILLNTQLKAYDAALDDMVWVRDFVEKKEKHGLEFVVSLLALESGSADAYEVFKRYAEKIDPSAKAQLIVATFALSANQPEAVLSATDAVQASGDDAQKEQGARLRSKALLALNRTDEAIATLQPIVKDTKDNDLKLDYGRMLIMADRREEARPVFKQLYATQPENADILYTLGLLYLEQEEYAFAEPLMKKLLNVPERKYEASYFLAQIYEGQQRLDDALAAYDDALNGDFAKDAVGRKSSLLLKEQGLEVARGWLAGLIEKASLPAEKVTALMADGQLLHDAGQYQAAIDSFNKAEQFGSSKRDILYARSLSYDRLGNVTQAEKDLQEVLKDDPEDADSMNALGYMLTVNTTRYDEARQLIEQSLALRPASPAVMDSMGWVMFKQGELEGAEKWLRQAFEKMEDPEVASHLIEVLSARGKRDEARQILQDMLVKYPEDKLLADVKERLVGLSNDLK